MIQKPEQAKMAAGKAEQSAKDNLSKLEESKQAEQAKQEAAKAEKRKSGFFGWLKRKVKGEKS